MPATAIAAAVAELLLSTDESEMRLAVHSSVIIFSLLLAVVFFGAIIWAHSR